MKNEIQTMNEIFKGVIDHKVYAYARRCVFETKTSESWRGRIDLSRRFYKEEKEALNAMVFFIILIDRMIKEGAEINFNACIAYVIKRLVRKALTWDCKPENKLYLNAKSNDKFEVAIDNYVYEELAKNTSKSFADAIYGLANQISKYEKECYLAAKHYTNWVEFKILMPTIFHADVKKIEKDLKGNLQGCRVNEYISSELGKLVSRLSWARNVIRWQGCGYTLNCNILCHMFETAVFGWLMAIELNLCGRQKKISPQRAFLVGLYHDVSEIWTDDIPSTCKNKIGLEADKKLRPLTEIQEKEALNEHFYPSLSKDTAEYFKENIMLEEIEDEEFHKFIKNADYFSADCEVYWMIQQGSKNSLYMDVLKKSLKEKSRTPEINKLLRKMICDIYVKKFINP